MSSHSRGPVEKAAPARSTKRKPKGFDKRGIHPQTAASGNKKMNRVLKGADTRGQKPGKMGHRPKSLEGKFF